MMGEVKKVHPMIDFIFRHKHIHSHVFELFENYLDLTEQLLESEQEKRQRELEQMRQELQELPEVIPEITDEEKLAHLSKRESLELGIPYLEQFYDLVSTTHYSLLRGSFFLALYAFFEAEWRDLERWFDLEKFDKGNSREWMLIQDYKMLRHCLVHYSGRFDEIPKEYEKDKRKLENFVTHNKNLSLSWGKKEIIIEKGFCEEALKVVRKLFETIALETPWKQTPWERRKQAK